MNGERRIRNEKLWKHQYMEEYARCLECKREDWDVGGNVKRIWEQVNEQWLAVQVWQCGSVRVRGKNPKDLVKSVVERKEAA